MSFNSNLTNWFDKNKRELPWRKSNDPYKIWLSEIILQQTQVKQGLPYYNKFLKNYPNIYELARSSEDEVMKNWQGLGYYSRARNLHFTAKYIVHELNGVFPKKYIDLIKLKGVGDYTASAIASICFDESVAVLDGNVFRVLSRYFGIEIPINSTQGIKHFKSLAKSLLPKKRIGDYNQAVMEFGALQCKPKSPNCSICPINVNCVAFTTNNTKNLPIKIKRSKIKDRYFNFLVYLTKKSETVIEKRNVKGIWQQLYQFPLIETESSVSKKNLMSYKKGLEKYNLINPEIELINKSEIVHKLSHQRLHIKFWKLNKKIKHHKTVYWNDLKKYPVPSPIAEFIRSYKP
jgi:A/G-specific adenine glycosylase